MALILCASILSSCRSLYPGLMFRAGISSETVKTDSSGIDEYIIGPGDLLSVQVFSNSGYELINTLNQQTGFAGQQIGIQYLVEKNGYIRLPVIDSMNISGLTIKQAEILLKEKYAEYYKEPFIILRVTNRRVFVFFGGKNAVVATINNENTSVIEIIAQAGGIPINSKAHKIKLIRGHLDKPEIILIDLSTIEGMKKASLNVRANDIIYIEPTNKLAGFISTGIAPYFSILGITSSVLTIVLLLGGRF